RLVDGRDPLDPFTGQLSPAQGPYALRMQAHYWAFYLMAENLRAETCVLEHPTLGEFEAELRKGYDWLGLQLNWNTLREAARMIERARVVAPRTRIVVGGYALPQVMDPLPADHAVAETIRAGADQLCWTEGVTYMRTLLDDGPIERPITQYTLPKSVGHLAALGPGLPALESYPVLVALGCPAGCDFCNTSAFFRRRKLTVAEPYDVFRFMRHRAVQDGGARLHFELFDEDFFWDPAVSRELGVHLRKSPETRGRVAYFTFGSVRTLSRFDAEELAANGLGMVWIGVESTLDDVLAPGAHLGKRKGRDVATLFRELRDVGIQVIGSLVLGFDFHTPETIRKDVDAFIALDPTISQVTPLLPCAGTALYERLKQAGRLDPRFGWTTSAGFDREPPMVPLHVRWDELRAAIEEANRRLFEETGPSSLKALDTALRGHLRLRGRADAALRARAAALGEAARRQYPLVEAVLANAPSARVAERAREVRERWREAFGDPPEVLVDLGRAFAARVRSVLDERPPAPAAAKAPTQWTFYRPGETPRTRRRVPAGPAEGRAAGA
ncbi:MAG TPA: radical SAM protein, partial [Candidatus Binatia bacterium]|nr:radical SAM protein [Candidatus Binatia bacterium]